MWLVLVFRFAFPELRFDDEAVLRDVSLSGLEAAGYFVRSTVFARQTCTSRASNASPSATKTTVLPSSFLQRSVPDRDCGFAL